MASDHHVNIFFESKALASDTFAVIRFEGEEAISRPFRFEIELVSDQPDIDLAAVLGRPATLSLQRGDDGALRKIHGVLAEFEQAQEGQYGHYLYRAVLVPRLWMLSLSRQNQIYQNKSAIEIVEEELKGAKNKGPAELAAIGLTAQDFEFRLSGNYVKREYTVQYGETDLDFVSRLMEHEGVFYFFEHDDEREKIVFCDDNVHVPALNAESKISYTPPSGTSSSNEDSVQALRGVQRQITAKMILKDYNYRTPTTPLQGEADIDDKGHGLISEYGNHFKTPEEGQTLAKIRAEEILCRKVQFAGESDRLAFAAGAPFTLEGHYNSGFDRDYLLIRVRHTGAQAFAEATGFAGIDDQATSYRNDFTAIPLDVSFHPARVTPRPKLHGVMNAQVDASGPGTRAEIDAEGRYKLVMPFDLSGQAKGKATRWVRMAQPYGGGQQGMHFPLHKGTEVIWTCVDGDPDRPIITGVVPNPLNRSIVNADSNTKNRIQTASGILIEMNDGAGPPAEDNGQGQDGSMGQQQMQRLPGPATADTAPVTARPLLAQQQHQQTPSTVTESAPAGPNDIWLKLGVPNYTGTQSSYRRYGKADPSNESLEGAGLTKDPANKAPLDPAPALELNNAAKKPASVNHALDGVLDYTGGNRTEITMHNREVTIAGKSRINIGGGDLGVWDAGKAYTNYMRQVGKTAIGGSPIWRHTDVSHASSDSWQWGDSESGFAGFKFDGFAGLATTATIGGSLNVGLTADVDFGAAYNVNMKWGPNVDFVSESQNTLDAKNHDMIADETISLRIKGVPEQAGEKTFLKMSKATWVAVGATTAGALVGGGAGAGLSYLYQGGGDSQDDGSTWGSSIGFTAATAAWAAGLALGIYKNKTTDKFQTSSPAQINLDNGKIELLVGPAGAGSSIVMTPTSIKFMVGPVTEIELTANNINFSALNITQKSEGGPIEIKSPLGGVTIKGVANQTILAG